MNVLAYFNERPMAMLDGYVDGDTVQPSILGEIVVRSPTPEGAANIVWGLMNRDDRPNGQHERSLSVGDVVRVDVPSDHDGGTGYRVWLAAEQLGWREIEGT